MSWPDLHEQKPHTSKLLHVGKGCVCACVSVCVCVCVWMLACRCTRFNVDPLVLEPLRISWLDFVLLKPNFHNILLETVKLPGWENPCQCHGCWVSLPEGHCYFTSKKWHQVNEGLVCGLFVFWNLGFIWSWMSSN